MSEANAPAGVDPAIPNVARMYDYYLGGKNNYAADREAAERILQLMPDARRWVRENRLFLAATVDHLASLGVRQFVDVGAGLPTQNSVHEIAPEARVVYVDSDPVVVAHARALVADHDRVAAVRADMRDPRAIFGDRRTRELIDLGEPVAVLLVAVLHFVPDDAEAITVVRGIVDELPSGSYLLISHATPGDVDPTVVAEGRQVYASSSAGSITPRTPDQLTALFDGLEFVPPGLTMVTSWQPGGEPELTTDHPGFAGAIARKP